MLFSKGGSVSTDPTPAPRGLYESTVALVLLFSGVLSAICVIPALVIRFVLGVDVNALIGVP